MSTPCDIDVDLRHEFPHRIFQRTFNLRPRSGFELTRLEMDTSLSPVIIYCIRVIISFALYSALNHINIQGVAIKSTHIEFPVKCVVSEISFCNFQIIYFVFCSEAFCFFFPRDSGCTRTHDSGKRLMKLILLSAFSFRSA